MEKNPKTKSQKNKRKWTLFFILLNVAAIGVTAFLDFKGSKPEKMPPIDLNYLLAAFGCFVVAIVAETIRYMIMLKHATGKLMPRQAFEVAALGKYYDYITPLGSGGQPFQVVYLLHEGVDVGASTAMPIAGYLSVHASFVVIALYVYIFGTVINSMALKIPATIGLVCYIAAPLTVLVFAVAPALTAKVLAWGIKMLAKLNLIKNPQATTEKLIGHLYSVVKSMKSILSEKGLFAILFLLGFVYQMAICSMPFFVLRTFGSQLPYMKLFCSCVYIYLCITFVPTPGNSGAAEGSFYALFSVLGQSYLFWAMLIWRFFCYYSFILLGFVIVSMRSFRRNKRQTDGETVPEAAESAPDAPKDGGAEPDTQNDK